MNLPTQQQCRDLWDKYEMPANIRAHTEKVTLVADKVAQHIKNQGIDVDLELVNRAGLLHDIAKWQSINQLGKHHHGEMGATVIKNEGFSDQLGRVVENHAMHAFSFKLPIEDQIINYADRRVKHDQIVTLDKRIEDLKERYAAHAESIEKSAPLFYEFEDKYDLAKLRISNLTI